MIRKGSVLDGGEEMDARLTGINRKETLQYLGYHGSVIPDDLERAIEHVRIRYSADVRKLESPNLDISSHNIREWLSEGWSTRYYLPDEVLTYILDKDIYGGI